MFGQASNSETNLLWRDARDLIIEGRGWPDTKDFYDRLPARAENLVRQDVWNLGHDSAGLHPGTPIVMVENVEYTDGKFVEARQKRFAASNAKLGEIHKRLTKAGQKKLFYVSAPSLLGNDGEATVDGTHPTDLGFVRMAGAIEPALRRALKSNR